MASKPATVTASRGGTRWALAAPGGAIVGYRATPAGWEEQAFSGPGAFSPIRYRDRGVEGTVDVPAVPVVDTLGAGDVLHGAYAFAIARGEAVADALRFAAGHASGKCRYPGVRAWLQTL